MGGLEVNPAPPDANYEFEMIEADTRKLFMHFRVSIMGTPSARRGTRGYFVLRSGSR